MTSFVFPGHISQNLSKESNQTRPNTFQSQISEVMWLVGRRALIWPPRGSHDDGTQRPALVSLETPVSDRSAIVGVFIITDYNERRSRFTAEPALT